MSAPVEERGLQWYKPGNFYPVRIGDTLQRRYNVLGKLGFGSSSTAWLCKDILDNKYVACKIYERNSLQASREVNALRKLNTMTSSNVGCLLVRPALDDFELSTPSGKHVCVVHPPLATSLYSFRMTRFSGTLPEIVLKSALVHILHALDFLHTEAGMIHGDIQENNILLESEDDQIFKDFEQAEGEIPSSFVEDGDYVVYQSRSLGVPQHYGRPILCDFGEARFGSEKYLEDIQPLLYRAPEVLLRTEWDSKVDMWNLGVMVWDMTQGRHLFDGRDAAGTHSNAHHLAEMIAILGQPPRDMLQNSQYASEFFDDQGRWTSLIDIPSTTLETSDGRFEDHDQREFLRFMRRMLCWRPEERASAGELLEAPWLTHTISG